VSIWERDGVGDLFLSLLVLAGGTWFAGIFGAFAVVKKNCVSSAKIIAGFVAGVILMVSFVELLHPAIHLAENLPLPAWIVVPATFALGFFSALLFDFYIARVATVKYKQGALLLATLSSHSVPEGLALGVLLGAGEIWAIAPVFIAVGLHKFPEGAAISVAFHKDGMTKLKSFLFGQTSGFLAFFSGAVGFAIVVNVDSILPYAMGFAGGAMIWVAVCELIPKSKVIGVFFGIVLMLLVDTTLHVNTHVQCCQRISSAYRTAPIASGE
jgi:ZIP family zinc transporter